MPSCYDVWEDANDGRSEGVGSNGGSGVLPRYHNPFLALTSY
ncbi:MAG TPA: hypothetical protein VIP56_07070 [Nitrososphaeraceae archaeon]